MYFAAIQFTPRALRCAVLLSAANKTVFNIQYTDNNSIFQGTICPYTTQFGLISIRKAADQTLNARPWDTCAIGMPTPPVSVLCLLVPATAAYGVCTPAVCVHRSTCTGWGVVSGIHMEARLQCCRSTEDCSIYTTLSCILIMTYLAACSPFICCLCALPAATPSTTINPTTPHPSSHPNPTPSGHTQHPTPQRLLPGAGHPFLLLPW